MKFNGIATLSVDLCVCGGGVGNVFPSKGLAKEPPTNMKIFLLGSYRLDYGFNNFYMEEMLCKNYHRYIQTHPRPLLKGFLLNTKGYQQNKQIYSGS